jgi:DNA-binding MarR family transcriptional regulator
LQIEKRLDHSIVQYILGLGNSLRKNGEHIAARVDLTTQQWMILLLLAEDPNHPFNSLHRSKKIMASDLADALGVSRPNITNLLGQMIEKGLVEQTEDGFDRRKKRLEITPIAKGLLQAIEPLRIDANKNLFSEFTNDEKEIFLSYLQRCVQFMNR